MRRERSSSALSSSSNARLFQQAGQRIDPTGLGQADVEPGYLPALVDCKGEQDQGPADGDE